MHTKDDWVPSSIEQLVGLYGFMLLCIWNGGFPIQWTKEAGDQSESGKRTILELLCAAKNLNNSMPQP